MEIPLTDQSANIEMTPPLDVESPPVDPRSVTPTALDDDVRRWVQVAIEAAEEKLGKETTAYFVGDVMGITDWFVVTSGSNARQVRAIIDNVEEQLALIDGPRSIRIEGKETLQWVLADFGSIVVHVFDDENREYYDLDRLWSDVPTMTA